MGLLTFTFIPKEMIPVIAVAAFALYCVCLGIYRLYLHPLAKFPGPKLSALSQWYEFYYDVYLRGQFMWEIQRMHNVYGPIIRINPNEIHVNDAAFSEAIYGSSTRKRNKYSEAVMMFHCPTSALATVDHDLHRTRRAAISPFFSKHSVTLLEPLIQEKVNKLDSMFENAAGTGEVLKANVAFMALTFDLICRYSFNVDDNLLGDMELSTVWNSILRGASISCAVARQFPTVTSWLSQALPPKWMGRLQPSMKPMMDWRLGVIRRIELFMKGEEKESGCRSIFQELRNNPNLPPEEKSLQRLVDECMILTGAGTGTTAQMLTTTLCYLLLDCNKSCLVRLKEELKTVLPTPTSVVPVVELERLPYFSAVISEGLRLSHGSTTRSPRIAVGETLQYKKWVIPDGTPIGQTAYFTLMSPNIFPEPELFLPARWLLDDGSYNRAFASKYLVNFGRGTRQCVGMNLAYAEIHLVLARILRRFDLELFETDVSDVKMVHDFVTSYPREDSKGMRIRVSRVLVE